MKTIYEFKPVFQGFLRPLVHALARGGITANQVTIAACTLSIVSGTIIYMWGDRNASLLLLLPLVLFARMALNAVDGMLAREHNMKSALGGFLNELTDVISDAALYLPMLIIPGVRPVWVVLLVLLAVVSELTGVVAVVQGASRRYDGPMGKSDRAFAIGLLGLLVGVGVKPGAWINLVLCAVCILLVITIVNRVRSGLREIKAR